MKNLLRDTDYKETAHCSDAHNIDIHIDADSQKNAGGAEFF